MIGHALREAVEGVESMARIGGGHDPFVVRLVENLVNFRMVQAPVDPVNEEIGEEDEDWKLQVVIQGERLVGRCIIQFGITAHFTEEDRCGEYGHAGESDHCLAHFEGNLVFEVFGVGGGCMVEDEEIG